MLRIIASQLRRRAGRAVAVLLGIMVATTGFTVLTGSTATSRLVVSGQVNAHYRGAYDILVRPGGSRTPLEQDRGLLRPNFLTSQYGGISRAQWHRIAAVDGVDVAAPIGTLGYAPWTSFGDFDLTPAVDPAATRQVIRRRQVWRTDRGRTLAADAADLVYVTKRPVIHPVWQPEPGQSNPYRDGRSRPNPCGAGTPPPVWEVQEDGRELPLCLSLPDRVAGRSRAPTVVHLDAQGQFHFPGFQDEEVSPRLNPLEDVTMSFGVAAIDPVSEARLVGLDRAVVGLPERPGSPQRYLEPDTPEIGAGQRGGGPMTEVPALGTLAQATDEQVFTRVERIAPDRPLAGAGTAEVRAVTASAPVAASHDTAAIDGRDIQLAATDRGLVFSSDLLSRVGRPGPVAYEVGPDGVLRPREQAPAADSWGGADRPPPLLWSDRAFRATGRLGATPEPDRGAAAALEQGVIGIMPRGFYDPAKLTRFDPLAQAPLETYYPDRITGATAADREALGGRAYAPNSNPGGYTSPPPTYLISLNWLEAITGEAAPISAVRVRVAGVTGFDKVSRERVRRVADDIARYTGLDVEVTLGASPSAQAVALPAGRYGRPALRLSEEWTRKGVAASIVAAVDRKSAVLFVLILAVCLLFLSNAVTAAVRDRRRELAVLACLGWPGWRLAGTVLGEMALLGALAGGASAALAGPVGRLAGVPVGGRQALWAVPAALVVALLSAVVPAWGAAARRPLAGVLDTVQDAGAGRRRRLCGGVTGMALVNLRRVPGRTAVGASALAVGVAGLTMLAAITWTFHGTITGSLLGDAVSVRVRGVDTLAVVATVLLGLVSIADVLYLNVRERTAEMAVLRAMGWSRPMLGRLVAIEGLGIGVLGALAGGAAGVVGAAWFAGAAPARLWLVAGGVSGGAVILAGAVALVPALAVRRLPVAARLAAD